MKSRHFTKPAQKPAEDEIVDSMNIVTLDMLVPDERQANPGMMNISEPDEHRQATINNNEDTN